LPTPRQTAPVPIRSTGASNAIGGLGPVVHALGDSRMVIDLTVEGLMHAPETRAILKAGTRILYVSNEHPDVLERLMPDDALKTEVDDAVARVKASQRMHVTSPAGSDLSVDLERAPVAGVVGFCDSPGRLDHWPGGVVVAFPRAGTVNGTLVLDRGDLNLTFKRYLEHPVRLRIEDDYVVEIEGDGVDAELMRSYFSAWDDREAYATSHVGFGLNRRARWDAMTMYDRSEINGTEQRAFAGNFLFSTGANEFANRYTLGHFDLPMRNCTIALDDLVIIREGALTDMPPGEKPDDPK
jgi:2,5-dihydroxypyridine 5,6-dioxygenase